MLDGGPLLKLPRNSNLWIFQVISEKEVTKISTSTIYCVTSGLKSCDSHCLALTTNVLKIGERMVRRGTRAGI